MQNELDMGDVRGSGDASTASFVASLPILAFTFILAFCSIVYELLLGQTLSAFLGNTVLRYSVTIGLYMFSMGVGALIAGPRLLQTPVFSLQVVEIALAVTGLLAVPMVFLMDAAGVPVLLLSLSAHAVIIVIGVLTGLEIPLLIEIQADRQHAASRTLGVDYLGAFAGTVAFALWCYPYLGLFATAVMTAMLNAAVGVLLPIYLRLHADVSRPLLAAQAIILLLLIIILFYYPIIEEAGIGLYLRQ